MEDISVLNLFIIVVYHLCSSLLRILTPIFSCRNNHCFDASLIFNICRVIEAIIYSIKVCYSWTVQHRRFVYSIVLLYTHTSLYWFLNLSWDPFLVWSDKGSVFFYLYSFIKLWILVSPWIEFTFCFYRYFKQCSKMQKCLIVVI